MRDKVLGYGWPFLPQWSSNSRRRPRLFDWTDDPSAATVDTAVYMSGAIREGVGQPGRKVAWILESPSIARWQRTVPWIEQHLDEVTEAYEVILASDRDFCTLHPKIRYHPAGSNLPWIPEARYGIYKKDRMCSMFASDKKMVEEHRYRREVAARLADRLDLFGGAAGSPRIGGHQRHPDKSEGLLHYRFQVVMENSRADFYYTEKITDCFATGTVPIYWGSESLGEICDTDGVLTFSDDFDPRDLSEDLYYEMLPAVRRNLDAVKALESADDLLYRRYVATSRAQVVGEPVPSEPVAIGSWDAERVLACTRSPTSGTSEEALLRRIRQPRQRIDEARQVPSDRISTLPVRTRMKPPFTPDPSPTHPSKEKTAPAGPSPPGPLFRPGPPRPLPPNRERGAATRPREAGELMPVPNEFPLSRGMGAAWAAPDGRGGQGVRVRTGTRSSTPPCSSNSPTPSSVTASSSTMSVSTPWIVGGGGADGLPIRRPSESAMWTRRSRSVPGVARPFSTSSLTYFHPSAPSSTSSNDRRCPMSALSAISVVKLTSPVGCGAAWD